MGSMSACGRACCCPRTGAGGRTGAYRRINVKNITGGYTETTGDGDKENNNTSGTTNVSKTVNIKVNSETRTGISKNETNYSLQISGKEGEASSITVTITDPNTGAEIYSSTQQVTFGSQDSLTFK